MSLENGRSKLWFGIFCYYYWEWIDTPHYFLNRHAEEKQKKCGRLEVYNLVKQSVEFEIPSDVFTEILNSLIENELVIYLFRNRECISLPNKFFQEIETEKEDITEQFHQFKNDFSDEFQGFKTKFFHEVKSLKDSVLNTTPKKHRKPGTYNQIIIRWYYTSERPAAPKRQSYRCLNQSIVKTK